MKVKIIRASGNPVDPEKAAAYDEDWRKGFDAICEEHGKYGEATHKALDALEERLKSEYNDLTVLETIMPKTKKGWKELLESYGNVMVTSCIEDGEHAKTGDLLLVVNDTMF